MGQDITIYNRFIAAGSSSNDIVTACMNAGSSSQDAYATAYPSSSISNFNFGLVTKSSGNFTASVFNGDIYRDGQYSSSIDKRVYANFSASFTTPIYVNPPIGFSSDVNSNFLFNYMVSPSSSKTIDINTYDILAGLAPTASVNVDEFPGGGTGAVTFDGISQYFTALNSEVVSWLPGTGDFTIEFFIKNGTQTVGAPRVFSLGFDTGATIGISIEGGYVYVWPYGSSLRGSLPASYNNGTAWMHVAICRSGTTTKLYMNGTLKATKTGDNRNINDSINPGYDLNVGVDNPIAMSPNWWAGKLTNFRWDNSAIYTSSSLVVPTAPLTATATTKLLMLGGGSTNPVYDAAKLNHLVNHSSVWDAETPFV